MRLLPRRLPPPPPDELDSQLAEQLRDQLESLCLEMGAPPVSLRVSDSLNFRAEVRTLTRAIWISRGAIQDLGREHAPAMLAHEIAHVLQAESEDASAVNERKLVMMIGCAGLTTVGWAAGGLIGVGGFVLGLAGMIHLTAAAFAGSHQLEYDADARAAQAVGAEAYSSMLRRLRELEASRPTSWHGRMTPRFATSHPSLEARLARLEAL